ncbi:acyl carrier protein [Parasediminibacterium sp. JCM 36343]|uniref:acyl carrier protein n=1 Tax=Parasediminibacterium sp. JCM 36343 TaxID=3374279 RepID=UPI00397B1C33
MDKQQEVKEKLKVLLQDKTGLAISQLADTASFTNDLAVDSLDIMEILTDVEKTFSIKITDEDAEKIITVGDLCCFVQKEAA